MLRKWRGALNWSRQLLMTQVVTSSSRLHYRNMYYAKTRLVLKAQQHRWREPLLHHVGVHKIHVEVLNSVAHHWAHRIERRTTACRGCYNVQCPRNERFTPKLMQAREGSLVHP